MIANKVIDAPARDGFIGPRRPVVPAWKAMSRRFNASDEDEDVDDDDASTMGCSSKTDTFADQARLEGVSAMEFEDAEGRIGRQEHFFRGLIAIQALNRKEAVILRRTFYHPRSASSDISDGEDLKKTKQKVYICIYGTIAIFNGVILIRVCFLK